jgi:DNA-binding MarR family transcriptional regulator
MNQILTRLEEAGLVECRLLSERDRVLQAFLTNEGEKLRRDCATQVDAIEGRMVAELSEEERSWLLGMVRRCSAALWQDSYK